MTGDRRIRVVFVSEEDLGNLGRTWATVATAIAGSGAIVAIVILQMLVFTPRPGTRWLFYGVQPAIAAVNLARAGYLLWRQIRIETKKRSKKRDPAIQ